MRKSVGGTGHALCAGLLVVIGVSVGGASRGEGTPHGTMSLGEAYRLALRQSEQVQIAVGNRDLADSAYADALTIMGPTAGINSGGFYENRAEVPTQAGQLTGVQPPYQFTMQAAIVQPLFRRQIFDARRAARLGIEGADALLKRAKQQLMMDTTTSFIAVLQDRHQVTIAQAAVKRAEIQVKSASNKVKAGGALRTAELLAQIELNREQTAVNTAEAALKLQESVFERLVGIPPPENLVLPPTPAHESLDEAARKAMDQRADVRALRLATQQAKATVTFLQGKIFWPTLDATLFAGYNVFSSSNNPTTDVRFPTYGVRGALSVPLFQTGDEWIQVRLQRQRVGIAAFQESLLRRQAADDVRQAMARIVSADKAIGIANEQQKTAQDNYQMVTNQYKIGGNVTPIDVLTAQSAVVEAETNKVLATYQRELATYQLLFAEGKIELSP